MKKPIAITLLLTLLACSTSKKFADRPQKEKEVHSVYDGAEYWNDFYGDKVIPYSLYEKAKKEIEDSIEHLPKYDVKLTDNEPRKLRVFDSLVGEMVAVLYNKADKWTRSTQFTRERTPASPNADTNELWVYKDLKEYVDSILQKSPTRYGNGNFNTMHTESDDGRRRDDRYGTFLSTERKMEKMLRKDTIKDRNYGTIWENAINTAIPKERRSYHHYVDKGVDYDVDNYSDHMRCACVKKYVTVYSAYRHFHIDPDDKDMLTPIRTHIVMYSYDRDKKEQ